MLEPERAIDRLRGAFSPPEGYRTLHAKGGFYTGTFTAMPEATELCRAGHLSGAPVPVTVRWSNAGGNPRVGDQEPDIRGMAVSFHLPDGTVTDLLGQTSPRFPVRTPEDFVSMTEASRRPHTLLLWLARHPAAVPAILAGLKSKAVGKPFSYAEIPYYPLHAYRWLDAAGRGTWVRYTFAPLAGRDDRPAGPFGGPDRLRQEITERLGDGPVRFEMRVQVAGPGDDPHDVMSVWRRARELVAGHVEVTGVAPDPETSSCAVVFDPTRVVDGIELSEDPILRYRPEAYAESVSRRTRSREG
jgi:catalase